MFGFYRVASVINSCRIADIEANCQSIIELSNQAAKANSAIIVFPELTLSAYSCKDLFFRPNLEREVSEAVKKIVSASKAIKSVIVFGMPLKHNDLLYNVAVVVQSGKILGVVPKQNLPNYKEFNEKRYFVSGNMLEDCEIELANEVVPFSKSLIFEFNNEFSFGIEICEDFWSLTPPSAQLIANGAKLICNLAASTEYVGKHDLRTQLISAYSNRCNCAYLLSSAACGESIGDSIHAGHAIVAENGAILVNSKPFARKNEISYADVDFERIAYARLANSSFNSQPTKLKNIRRIKLADLPKLETINYANISKNPFLGASKAENAKICAEIFEMQANALANKIEFVKAEKILIGISGGLDSTLALVVCCEACKILGMSPKTIMAVTMPGFGTSDRTYYNAVNLCNKLDVTLQEISIRDSVTLHLKDIDHDINLHDVTYENSQARERTQILMDLANKYRGIVVGTGDLSEIALGWCTYNGDHMAMYSVNSSVPKTLMRHIIAEIADNSTSELQTLLYDIIDTPVSPELLPSDSNGEIAQKTEAVIGPYELHDFFIYHFIKNGAEPKKLEFMANQVFQNEFSADLIHSTLKTFIRRFFSQQFKRNCMPEGPKVTEVSLSSRGDWQMSSEVNSGIWLKELD